MKNLLQLTDLQLINFFKEGNNPALEVLLMRHKDKVFSSILYIVKDKYLAEDLFQDTFIRIIDFIRQNRYAEEGKFISWAIRIAHNLCIDHFRKVKKDPIVKTGNNTDIFEVLSISQDNSDHNMDRSQTAENLSDLLDLIPAEQREVIVLRHYADLSFKEIADMANCSINTALGRMRYGLINLRKMIAEKQISL